MTVRKRKAVTIELRLPRDVLAYYEELSRLSLEPTAVCISVMLATQVLKARNELKALRGSAKKKAARPEGGAAET